MLRQLVQSHAGISHEAGNRTQVIVWLRRESVEGRGKGTEYQGTAQTKALGGLHGYRVKWKSKKKVSNRQWQKASKTSRRNSLDF